MSQIVRQGDVSAMTGLDDDERKMFQELGSKLDKD